MKPLRVGSKVYKGTRLCHVRAFVVIRFWSMRGGWRYEVWPSGAFEQNGGTLFRVDPYGPKIRSEAT